jgi:uncharacterized protein YbjT (DUF2867 family)
MILVVGASGRLGSALVARLVEDGLEVRATARDLGRLPGSGYEKISLDLRDPKRVRAALQGIRQVVACVQSLTARAADSVRTVDLEGQKTLIDAAVSAGVDKFVFLSALGAASDHPAPFWAAKAAVEAHLMRSGVKHVIVRPGAFIDLHAHTLIGEHVLAGRTAKLLGRGEAHRNLVAIDDVVDVLVEALTGPALDGKIVAIFGPDTLSDREIVHIYAKAAGREAKVRAIPEWALGPLAALVGLFHAGAANLMRLPRQMAAERGDGEPPVDLIRTGRVSVADFARKKG